MNIATPEEAARYLAQKYNPPPVRRAGDRLFYVGPRYGSETTHRVSVATDGALLCTCEAGMHGKKCWAADAVQRELETMNATESRALVPVQVQPPTALIPTEREMALIERQAAIIFAGRVSLPVELKTKEQVAAVMMYGFELGLKPMTALKHLYIVNGRVQPSAEVMAGLVMSRYPDARLSIDSLDDTRCVMRLNCPSRGINDTYEARWSDIVKAGLANSDMNKKYPQDRLRLHATKRLLRIYFADVINGLDSGAPAFLEPHHEEERYDASDLYNAGDAPSPVLVNGKVIDAETGEMVEETPLPFPDMPAPETPAEPEEEEDEAPAEDAPASLEQLTAVAKLLGLCKSDWSSRDYAQLFRDCAERYMPGAAKFTYTWLTAGQAHDCVQYLRARRGETEGV